MHDDGASTDDADAAAAAAATDFLAPLTAAPAAVMEPSPRSQAMVTALNASLGLRTGQDFERRGARMDGVTTRVTAIETTARRHAEATTAQFEAINLRLQTVETSRSNAPAGGGGGGPDPWAQGWANYRASAGAAASSAGGSSNGFPASVLQQLRV